MLTFIDLFSGIGGFSLGLERAGMKCVAHVEIDPYCRRVLARHWDVLCLEDVRNAGRHNLPETDLICGGFPCQGLSVAGQRRGLADERSGFFWELVRVVSELRPEWLVLENVPGLLSSNDGQDFALVLGGITGMVPEVPAGGWKTQGIAIGLPDRWCAAWRVLDSQWFGVAQRRRRVFIVGHSESERAGAVLFEPESSTGHPATVRKAGADIAHCLDGRTGGVSGKENQETLVSYALNAHGGSCGRLASESETFIAHTLRANERNTSRGPGNYVACTLPASDGGVSNGYHPIVSVHENQRGEPTTSDTCGALGAGGGKPGQGYKAIACPPPDPDRVREAPGLPRGMDGRRYRALGNAVTVSVAEWIGQRIVVIRNL